MDLPKSYFHRINRVLYTDRPLVLRNVGFLRKARKYSNAFRKEVRKPFEVAQMKYLPKKPGATPPRLQNGPPIRINPISFVLETDCAFLVRF